MPTRIQELQEPARSFQKSRTFPFYESDLLVDEVRKNTKSSFLNRVWKIKTLADSHDFLEQKEPVEIENNRNNSNLYFFLNPIS